MYRVWENDQTFQILKSFRTSNPNEMVPRERSSTHCVLSLSNLREIPWSNWCLAKSWQMAIFTLLSPGQFLVSCLTERAIYLELFTTKLGLWTHQKPQKCMHLTQRKSIHMSTMKSDSKSLLIWKINRTLNKGILSLFWWIIISKFNN